MTKQTKNYNHLSENDSSFDIVLEMHNIGLK